MVVLYLYQIDMSSRIVSLVLGCSGNVIVVVVGCSCIYTTILLDDIVGINLEAR